MELKLIHYFNPKTDTNTHRRYFIDGKRVTREQFVQARDSAKTCDSFNTTQGNGKYTHTLCVR